MGVEVWWWRYGGGGMVVEVWGGGMGDGYGGGANGK